MYYDKPFNSPAGLTQKQAQQFSFVKAVRALAFPENRRFQEEAKFELEASQAMADTTRRTPRGLFIGEEILGLTRDMTTSTDTAGGYLVADNLATGSFIEMLQNSMVAIQAGATILRGLVGDLSIPRQTGGATAYWLGEGDDTTESTPALGQVNLRPKTVGAMTDLSRKLVLQSSLDAESWIRQELARTIGLAIDLAALAGTGASGQPLGITNTSGVLTKTLTGASDPTHAELCAIEGLVEAENAYQGKLAYAGDATFAGNLKAKDVSTSTGKFCLEGDRTSTGMPFYLSNQVTSGSLLFGNWADLILAYWSGIDVVIDRSTLSASGGVRVVCFCDCDVALRHAASFCLASGGS